MQMNHSGRPLPVDDRLASKGDSGWKLIFVNPPRESPACEPLLPAASPAPVPPQESESDVVLKIGSTLPLKQRRTHVPDCRS
jgi:hypothetical protein